MENNSQPLNREVSNSSTFTNPNNNKNIGNDIQANNYNQRGNKKSNAGNNITSNISSNFCMNFNKQNLNSGDLQDFRPNFIAIGGQKGNNNTDSSFSLQFGNSMATSAGANEPYAAFSSSNDISEAPNLSFDAKNPSFSSTAMKSDELHSMNSSSKNFCTSVSASIAASAATLRANFTAAAAANASASAASARNQQNAFLYDLFDIISDPYNNEIISWLPHGKGFIINNKNRFERLILPDFLPNTKYASFTRRLKRWKFFR